MMHTDASALLPDCVYVLTGEVKVVRGGELLNSSAVGSCVVVCMYEQTGPVAGMAHVLLPGYAPKRYCGCKTRYAAHAIEELVHAMAVQGANIADMSVAIVGGANVLKKPNDTIAKQNIESVVQLLAKRKLTVRAAAVGGTVRRTAILDSAKKHVFFTEGDSSMKILMSACRCDEECVS